MERSQRDSSLDVLLDLNGQTLFVHERYWVKFVVIEVDVTAERPHGLNYSLTLHEAPGERIVGFDNAHPIGGTSGPAGKGRKMFDHKHHFKTVRPYEYRDAASLLADFWAEVDAVLREKGIIP